MRIPIRSEGEAVRFVFVSFAVIAVSVLVGWLVEPLVGVAIFAVAVDVVVAAIAYAERTARCGPACRVVWEGPGQAWPLPDSERAGG